MWNAVHNILKKSHSKGDVTHIKFRGKVVTDQGEICNAFNSHFSEAGASISEGIDCDGIKQKPCDYVEKSNKNFKFKQVSEMYIFNIVMDMKSKSSSGLDDVSNLLLKRLISVLKSPLCVVINKSLKEGVFPDLMKVAKIIPLHKGGECDVLDNYRPISLLPALSKVLERVVYSQTTQYFEENRLIYPKQYGFCKKHSTTDAIMNLTGDILKALDEGMMALTVFIDLRKAFDSVSHSIILEKLRLLGLTGLEYKWFESYLSNRQHRVMIGNQMSDLKNVSTGVPQGSLLGVLLFEIQINDICESLKYSQCMLYVDDTTLYVIGKSLCCMRAKIQADLSSLANWLKVNKLKLNVAKTKYMLFSKEGVTPKVGLQVDSEPIMQTLAFRYLGVWLDNELSFLHHYKELHLKLLKSVFLIRCLAKFIPAECLRTLYFAYYHPHLVYGLSIWWPFLGKALHENLYVLQKRIVRSLCRLAPRQHCMPYFKKLMILTVKDQLYQDNCKLVWKLNHSQCPFPIQNMYEKSQSQQKTRGSGVCVAKHRTGQFNKSFLCKPVMDWQLLTSKVKDSISARAFVKSLKTHLLQKY